MIVKQGFRVKCDSLQIVSAALQHCSGLCLIHYPDTQVIGIFPKWQVIALSASKTLLIKRQGLQQHSSHIKGNYVTVLSQQWRISQLASKDHDLLTTAQDFCGGLMGFIGYDLAASSAVVLKNCRSPAAVMGDYDIFFKQQTDDTGVTYWQLYGPDLNELQPVYRYIEALFSDDKFNKAKPPSLGLTQPFQPVWNFDQYKHAFDHIQNYLKQGDCYQVNLTQPFKGVVAGSLVAAIDPLMQLTKATYGGLIKYGDFELLSCSPELFIEFNPNRELVTKPIKGTRPRHQNADRDAQLKQELLSSEKDRAENLMIVDLLRNDLSVYAKTGSVHVPALFKIESFAQVHHLVSEIRATLKPSASPLDVLFSALPGGSITGAPKIRAMQIIDELEAESRGAYCGSMGYLNYDGTGSFNILIRSLQKHGNTLTAWAGGGITIASICEDEYQECLDKIGAILNCVNRLGEPE